MNLSASESHLNIQQKQAVAFGNGPLLIVAGAGTGKTTVITQRIAELIKNSKAKPEEILALTFTDKAAGEMRERVEKLLPDGYIDLWISTFHSFADRILRTYGLDIGLSTDFRLLDQTGAWLLLRQNLDKFNLDYYRPLGNPTKFIHALLSHFSRCKDEGIEPKDYLKYSDDLRLNLDNMPVGSKSVKSKDKAGLASLQQEGDRIKEIAETYHTYQQLLLENNYLDFGDLINYCLKLFEQRPKILEKFREQFKYILVDEFQDTNWSQYELVKLLAFPNNNITVCADDDQSIYRFRGSSFNNVLQFRKDYPNAKEIVLIENYRSLQNILDLSYKFIQLNNPNRLECHLNDVKEISKNAQRKGMDLKKFKKINKQLKAVKIDKGVIQYLSSGTADQEIQVVINKIIEIFNKEKDTGFNDFAILCRTNETANNFSRALARADIPHQFLSSKGLYSRPIILDIISYFRLLNNYYEDSSMYRILNTPCFGVLIEDIAKISQYSSRKGCSIYESLQQLPLIFGISQESRQKLNTISSLIIKHSAIAQQKNISEVFVSFLQDSGYLDFLIKDKKEVKQNLDLINQFYDKIKQFEEEQYSPKLRDFVQQIDMELQSGEEGLLRFNPEEGPDTVKIMTIHSAKGLEFKYVFLVNLVDKRFPTIERKEPIEIPELLIKEVIPEGDVHLQEERRLFYVGMTRAKQGLFFTSAKDYGKVRDKKPSRFLMECGMIKSFNCHSEERAVASDEESLASQNVIPSDSEESLTNVRNFSDKPRDPSLLSVTQGDKKENYTLPDHFSFTQLAAFEKCPLQYKFAHILRLPVRGKAAFTFGKTMHNTLFEFVSRIARGNSVAQKQLFFNSSLGETRPRPSSGEVGSRPAQIAFDELLKIYKQNWKDEWYENEKQKKEYYEKGKKSLKIFYDKFTKTQPRIKFIQDNPALEQGFNLKIGDYMIIGKIDRIDEMEDGVEIIDYKTGSAKIELKPEEKMQLLIYQIAVEQVLGLKPKKLTYYYLEDSSVVSFLGKDKDKENTKKKILEAIKKIEASDFNPTPGWQCKYCDFKNICEFRKL